MLTISELKDLPQTSTPVLLFECRFTTGHTEFWSTHPVTWNDNQFAPRVLSHTLFDFQLAGYEGIDTVSRISVVLSNTDFYLSQLAQTHPFKGARLTVHFAFSDPATGHVHSQARVVFQGIGNPPDEIRPSSCRLSFSSRLSSQRISLPAARLQRRCLWRFPATYEERLEAVHGGARGQYSPLFSCGYSPDIPGGCGNLNGAVPFTSCNYTREDCLARGMFHRDDRGNHTRRFSGCDFLPASILVRGHGDKDFRLSHTLDNRAQYNDPIPLVYGTGWLTPQIVFSRSDGNLTHLEAVLSCGEIEGVTRLLVNDVEIPLLEAGKDMNATGWYQQFATGNRTGNFNVAFLDSTGQPLGDPYGGIAAVAIAVPNRISDGRSVPRVKALVKGLKLNQYNEAGELVARDFTDNPAWVLLDLLQRSGWTPDELDIPSFARTASSLAISTSTTDPAGNPIIVPRFQCNLLLTKRRSAADVIRGVRLGASLMLAYNAEGRLQLRPEGTLAEQHPHRDPGSNAKEPLNGGWPAYEFTDGSTGPSNILARPDGAPSFRIWSRSLADTPNQFTVEYQDSLNDYQQDAYTLVDFDDVSRTGQEISARFPALGIPHFRQAARVLYAQLKRSVEGNQFIEFETSVKGVELTPGDIITVTYLSEGLLRRPFRIVKISPGPNFRTITIVAQLHDDRWYLDADLASGQVTSYNQQPSDLALPRPLLGPVLDETGNSSLRIEERLTKNAETALTATICAHFVTPRNEFSHLPAPILPASYSAEDAAHGLPARQTLYYGLTAVDDAGRESPLSFLLAARLPDRESSLQVTLNGIRLPAQAAGGFVYRGVNPLQLLRIGSLSAQQTSFTDAGNPPLAFAPPDANYHHANAYWRLELYGETPVTESSPTTIGSSSLNLPPQRHHGNIVRIVSGRGAGQERSIVSHSATTLTVDAPWRTLPDQTSVFVIAEGSWRFGAEGALTPLEFDVPGRIGATIHVAVRSANIHGKESDPLLAPLARWRIGESADLDWDIPPAPIMALSPTGRGVVEIANFGFPTLDNTRTITSATITLYYSHLAAPAPNLQLLQPLSADPDDKYLYVSGEMQPGASRLIQLGQELLWMEDWPSPGAPMKVRRAVFSTPLLNHPAGNSLRPLEERLFIIPFRRDFFGSPASGEFSYSLHLPNALIAAAACYATNGFGDSPTTRMTYTSLPGGGLRTHLGAQLLFQVPGYLAVQSAAAPPLVVSHPAAIRDFYALVSEAPLGSPVRLRLRRNAEPFVELEIPPGQTRSPLMDGYNLPALPADSVLTLDILATGYSETQPGKDLTVVIRL